jgi:hypothetical protein
MYLFSSITTEFPITTLLSVPLLKSQITATKPTEVESPNLLRTWFWNVYVVGSQLPNEMKINNSLQLREIADNIITSSWSPCFGTTTNDMPSSYHCSIRTWLKSLKDLLSKHLSTHAIIFNAIQQWWFLLHKTLLLLYWVERKVFAFSNRWRKYKLYCHF